MDCKTDIIYHNCQGEIDWDLHNLDAAAPLPLRFNNFVELYSQGIWQFTSAAILSEPQLN